MKPNRTNKSRQVRRQATVQSESKRVWHPLSLQNLRTGDFVDAVNRILDGRHDICSGTLRGATGVREEDELIEGLRHRLQLVQAE